MTEGNPVPAAGDLERVERSLKRLSLPDPLQRLVEAYIEKKTGKPWDDPIVLQRLRTAIMAQKREYWKEGAQRSIGYHTGYRVLAYLTYQMPVFFAQFQHLLLFLARDGLLKEKEMTVLDVGSGPGVVSLALIDFFRRWGHGSAIIHALDASEENQEAYRFLVPSFAAQNTQIRIEPLLRSDLTTLSTRSIPTSVDLMVFSNVLNEIPSATVEDRAAILRRYASALAKDGTIVLTEPADLANSTALRRISLAASGEEETLTLYAPCTFLWGHRCSTDRCWSFADYGEIQPPRIMQVLSEGEEGYRFSNTDIKASFALFRKDGRTRCPHRIQRGARVLPLSRLSRHVGKVVNVMAAVMSGDIGSSDYQVTLVCDGTSAKPVYTILPRYQKGPSKSILAKARYGDVLEFQEVLVRYNKTHDAYNLLITGRSRVRPLSPPPHRG
jgi:SAM-dependent methyltransferase